MTHYVVCCVLLLGRRAPYIVCRWAVCIAEDGCCHSAVEYCVTTATRAGKTTTLTGMYILAKNAWGGNLQTNKATLRIPTPCPSVSTLTKCA